ncbi:MULTISPECIES: hypothetical protein [unclassified Streptomyces]|nr:MULTISPECIES: hypothetical protein [unclassified Streptomyces]
MGSPPAAARAVFAAQAADLMEPAMPTVLFEARPEPGCYGAYRDHVMAL